MGGGPSACSCAGYAGECEVSEECEMNSYDKDPALKPHQPTWYRGSQQSDTVYDTSLGMAKFQNLSPLHY